MENKKITIENYQQNAMKTCLPSAKNSGYATLNYEAEYFELLAKIKSMQAKEIRDGYDFDKAKYLEKIKDELGDCYWQLALCCELRGLKFADKVNAEPIYPSTDCRIDLKRPKFYTICRRWIFQQFGYINYICDYYQFNILDILQRNIDKLQSRAERGVLKGSGDER